MEELTRFCVSVRYHRHGSLMSSWYDTLEEALARTKLDLFDVQLMHQILIDESALTVEIILGRDIEPFRNHLDRIYGEKKWKIGKIRKQ